MGEVVNHPSAWGQRRLRVLVDELFSGSDTDARDAFRQAITALLTRDRYSGTMTEESDDLDDAEQMGFNAMLNNIEHGLTLIRRLPSGSVEIRDRGWCHKVSFHPLRITSLREAG